MKKVYVGNLPYSATEDELREIFANCGEIESVSLITDRYTGQAKGFGFVTFGDDASAEKALSIDGQDLNGRKLKVNIARERESTGGGGGFGGGGGGGFGGNRGPRGGGSSDRRRRD